ncbi:EAL domain-containing protein [Bacillus sp. Marseille-Q1617]|uniref:EAL domain-containing protein n=1 Tax=Bacillus sp. Marseille-Q1617 TaxID=2736887 RepID=UPI00158B5124|nr:EAL domain-containing protein [Bacillus sp. Marseille-Q1617]
MFFLFLLLVALIPLVIGISIVKMFKGNKLSKVLFLFLLLASLWQVDVSVLFAHHILSREAIDFLFRLFRIGSIMVSPTLFFVAFIIYQEELANFQNSKWNYLMNKKVVIFYYICSFAVYLIGWSHKGIHSYRLIEPVNAPAFHFPVYGSLSWVFQANVLLFIISIVVCIRICTRISHSALRSFLFYFIISTAVGYAIGILNMLPDAMLLPSAVSVLLFAISILILSNKMHLQRVNDVNNQLDQNRDFLSKVIDLNPNYIYAKDQHGRYSLVNESFAALYGMDKIEIIGKTDFDVQVNKERAFEIYQVDQSVLAEQKEITVAEEIFINRFGKEKWLQSTKIPIKTKDSTILLGVSTDITEHKQHEKELNHQANHDVLTGLPNRRLLNENLTNILKPAGTKAALMLIDLDRFKYINDTLGHDVGDLLLIEVSKRLKQFIGKLGLANANVYRLGGDEFTLLFPYRHTKEVTDIANSLLEQFNREFILGEQEFFISPSIGISTYPEDGCDAKTLMKNADTAMYYVKEREKNGFQLFTKEMNCDFYRKMMIEKELRTALELGEFDLHYQPLMDIHTKKICGMEALIRWNNKNLGPVSPAEFIPIAEETGMIIRIGEWVLRTACEQNIRWQKAEYPPLKVGINISIRQLLDKKFVHKAAAIIKDSGLSPAYIDLEITESIAMYDPAMMINKLEELKAIGVSVSMDDFGTGYSSLSYLKKYPLDTLKIDRSFVSGITFHEDNKAIVNSIISMAKHLGLHVTAEGVEDEEEIRFLEQSQCDTIQGYAISRPLCGKEFEQKFLLKTAE